MLSVLLYNSEVWVIGKREMKDLEGKGVYFMRKVVGEKVRKEEEGKRLSNQQLREMLGVESVQRMIRKRRLQWVAHSARRGQGDFTWKCMRREIEDEESGWGEQIRSDWNELGVEGVDQWTKLVEDRGWLRHALGTMKTRTQKTEIWLTFEEQNIMTGHNGAIQARRHDRLGLGGIRLGLG